MMPHRIRRTHCTALASVLILGAALCGCSGNASSPAAASAPAAAPPAKITGLATPTSVAVVTATNTSSAP
jgi:outer membrane PBP1 activator LpoA protein